MNIFQEKFESFADALDKYIKINKISARGIAKKLSGDPENYRSEETQLSKWRNTDKEPGPDYRKRLNEILDVFIQPDGTGMWEVVNRKRKDDQVANDEINFINEALNEYEDRKVDHGFSDKEKALLFDTLMNDLKSATRVLGRLIEKESGSE